MKNRYALNTFGNFILFSLSEFSFWKTFPIYDFFCLAQWDKAIFKVGWNLMHLVFIFKEFFLTEYFLSVVQYLSNYFWIRIGLMHQFFSLVILENLYFISDRKVINYLDIPDVQKFECNIILAKTPLLNFWMFITIFQQKFLFHFTTIS